MKVGGQKLDAALFGRELLASLVVFLVALPLCMGVAIASGVPPALGLISGIIGGLVVGSLAGSPLQVSGPAAGLAVIVFEAVTRHGLSGLMAIVLIAGVLQMSAGMLRLGRWFRAVSPAVIYAMLAGIGVLIFASQFHVMVDGAPQSGGIANLLSIPKSVLMGISPAAGTSHQQAALIGIFSLVLLVGWNRFKPIKALPGALVAVVGSTAMAQIFALPIGYVTVPDNLLGSIDLPAVGTLLGAFARPEIWIGGLGMGIVASAESLLCASAVDKMQTHVRTDYDREMFAQGVGNVLAGLVGALPVTGVIVRSTANVESGGRTRLSAILHGLWLLGLVALFPGLLRLVPTSSLAAILVYTGYKLVNVNAVRELARQGRGELVVYAGTLIAIVATNLLMGIVLGVGLALAKLLWHALHIEITIERDAEERSVDVHVRGAATFVRLPKLAAALESIEADERAKVLLHVQHLDHACLELLMDWEQQRAAVSTADTEVHILPGELPTGRLRHVQGDAEGSGLVALHQLEAPSNA